MRPSSSGLRARSFPCQHPQRESTRSRSAAVLYIVIFWCAAIAEPAIRFWMQSRQLPAVQRARLRSLSLGYGSIIVLIILALGLLAGRRITPGCSWGCSWGSCSASPRSTRALHRPRGYGANGGSRRRRRWRSRYAN